jgi:hypothetical protein
MTSDQQVNGEGRGVEGRVFQKEAQKKDTFRSRLKFCLFWVPDQDTAPQHPPCSPG